LIKIYTKERHISKISNFLKLKNTEFEIYTEIDYSNIDSFDLGISYCYPKKIKEPLLSKPINGFINYHPGPLPKYKGPNEYEDAIKNKEVNWGVTVHKMTENFDDGEILKVKEIKLHDAPNSIKELGSISHYFLFELFKETIDEYI